MFSCSKHHFILQNWLAAGCTATPLPLAGVAVKPANLSYQEEARKVWATGNISRLQIAAGGAPVNGLTEGISGGGVNLLLPAGVLAGAARRGLAEGALHTKACQT